MGLPQGLTIHREWLPNGWQPVFTGPEAKGMMIERVMQEIERMYGVGWGLSSEKLRANLGPCAQVRFYLGNNGLHGFGPLLAFRSPIPSGMQNIPA